MLYQCGFEYKLCSLIRDLHYQIILQRRDYKSGLYFRVPLPIFAETRAQNTREPGHMGPPRPTARHT